MKQTALEKLGIAFRQWQTDWDNFDKTARNQPASYDEFIAPFLEMEKQQIMDATCFGEYINDDKEIAERYYNETYKSK
jgi:hypothetical protein